MMHYLYQSTVVEGESEHEVYLRLRGCALRTYDDIIMSKSWYSYPKHTSPIAYFSFTRDSDHDPHFEHQMSRGSWEGRHTAGVSSEKGYTTGPTDATERASE